MSLFTPEFQLRVRALCVIQCILHSGEQWTGTGTVHTINYRGIDQLSEIATDYE